MADHDYLMRYFEYEHLPPVLKEMSKPFCKMADAVDKRVPHGPEKTAGLRKLLEAKDCIVRAMISDANLKGEE